jgi:RNA polymerase sigma factor (sigma-70 family)
VPDLEPPPLTPTDRDRLTLLYHFCRVHLPAVAIPRDRFDYHIERTFRIYQPKVEEPLTWLVYLNTLYPIDWAVCVGCLEGQEAAWELLFAARTGRTDCLLVDALRARAVRLYPRDQERQETAVTEFWSGLIVSEHEASPPVLARYDGQRPLAPWLIRVFQNLHLSRLRQSAGIQALPDDDIALPLPTPPKTEARWHEVFNVAAREWLADVADSELLILGLRWRYKMSQREVAHLLGVHEGTISRQTDKLREKAITVIGSKLMSEGWTGDDLEQFILTELGAILTDEPRLSADQLASLLAARGKRVPN